MRIFELTNGGLPIYSDDFKFVNEGTNDFIDRLTLQFGENFILSGCDITDNGNDLTIAPGIVVIGGEPCRVYQQTVNTPNRTGTTADEAANGRGPYLSKSFSVVSDGDRNTVGGNPHSPWKERRAILNYSEGNGGYSHENGSELHAQIIQEFKDAVIDLVKTGVEIWVRRNDTGFTVPDTALLNGWEYSSYGSPLLDGIAVIKTSNIVSVDLPRFNPQNVDPVERVFYTLPAGVRPRRTLYVPVIDTIFSNVICLVVKPSGEMYFGTEQAALDSDVAQAIPTEITQALSFTFYAL